VLKKNKAHPRRQQSAVRS